MTPFFWTLAVSLALFGDSPSASDGRRTPNPLAPSLPYLTEKEERYLDRVIDRFIQFDTGKLPLSESQKAVSDFRRLGAEAIPALIRGLNRAAKIEASCPAVTIAKKLTTLLRASRDPELMEFARENIGAGVTQSRHMGVIKDLRVTCMLHKRAIGRMTTVTMMAVPEYLQALNPPKLVIKAADLEPGPGRDRFLRMLAKRPPDTVLPDLGAISADSSDARMQKNAREVLEAHLAGLDPKEIRANLKDGLVEVRTAAARVVAAKKLHFEPELIDLLEATDDDLRVGAHAALVRLNPGVDFGPAASSDASDREKAARRWRDWLVRQSGR